MKSIPDATSPFETATVSAAPDIDIDSEDKQLLRTTQAFKDANDERMCEIETRNRNFSLLDEKVDRVSRSLESQQVRLDSLYRRRSRPPIPLEQRAASEEDVLHVQHKAFHSYLRTGNPLDTATISLEKKAGELSVETSNRSGSLVPAMIEKEIGTRLARRSFMRELASVRTVSSGEYRRPFSTNGPDVSWAGERDARTSGNSPDIAELRFPAHELFARPRATQVLLDDAAVDLGSWLVGEVEAAFAQKESEAFINGNGSNRPHGILSAQKVDVNSWQWGSLGFISGKLKENGGSKLVDLIYSLEEGYRQNATFLMNRKTQAIIRNIKDNTGNYLWHPGSNPGSRSTLLGFPVVEAEDMPDSTANNYPIAFGDFSRGYLIVDRLGIRVLRDPYTDKPYVIFCITKRVGGGVLDFNAIRLLKST